MKFSFWANAGNSWADVLSGCRHAEATGWDGVWVADHFMPLAEGYGDETESGREPELEPVLEGWVTLAALAALVPRVRLGTMVTGNTYRHPAVLANMAATLDHVSGGRAVLGIGAGWQENEHRRYGIELGTVAERSDRFQEACELIHGLLRSQRTTFEGEYYRLDGAPMEPKPVQSELPLVVGGGGERRTLRTAARWADESNVWGPPELMKRKREVLDRHCEAIGRDPSEVRRTAAALLMIIDDEHHAERVRAALDQRGGLVGTVDQLRRRIDEYADAGVDELVVPDFNMRPADRASALDRFMADVVGAG